MRFAGSNLQGQGVRIAIIDSGIRKGDPRLFGADISGWKIQMSATNHALLSDDFDDLNGHGTELAVHIHKLAPKAQLIGIRIMDNELKAAADLLVAGIETAHKIANADIILISFGTPNMGKAMMLREACAMANETGAMIVASAHPQGARSYPADVPEVIGVTSHPDCQSRMYYLDPKIYLRRDWKSLSGKFVASGYFDSVYRGAGHAAAHFAAELACLRSQDKKWDAEQYSIMMQNKAFLAIPELGYS